MTLDELEEAVRNFFGDRSRSALATKDGLESVAELAAELAAAIDVDVD